MKVLIVDDSKTSRLVLAKLISDCGIDKSDIGSAENGQVAYELFVENEPELIITDWNMPVLDGMGLLNKLVDDGYEPNIGFVTSNITDDLRDQAMSGGAKFFLEKPITMEKLKPLIESL